MLVFLLASAILICIMYTLMMYLKRSVSLVDGDTPPINVFLGEMHFSEYYRGNPNCFVSQGQK